MKFPTPDPNDPVLPIRLSAIDRLIIEAVTMGVMMRDAGLITLSDKLRARLTHDMAGGTLVGDAVAKLMRDYVRPEGVALAMYDLVSEVEGG